MNLLAQNPQAHIMRCNLLRLLLSDRPDNQIMALTMMEAGGVPFVVLRRLRDIKHGDGSLFPILGLPGMKPRLQKLLDSGLAALPSDFCVYLQAWRYPERLPTAPILLRSACEQYETFERSVTAGIMTWEQWADCWHIDASLLRETCLTGLLLERGIPLDRNRFLLDEEDEEGYVLRKSWLGLLFTQHPEPEFQLHCLQSLVDRGCLNLSGTALTELPEVAGELKNVKEIDLGGTAISRLPWGLLASLEKVKGRRRHRRRILQQAMQEGPKDGILRLDERLRRGTFAYEAAQLDEASQWFEAALAAIPGTRLLQYGPRYEFVQACFGTAVETGHWESAVKVLDQMAEAPWKENRALRWEKWDVWKGLILGAGKEELFYAALEALPLRGGITPAQFFCFHWPSGWAHYFERLLYCRGLDDALQLLDRAKTGLPGLWLTMFRWDRILAHLKHVKKYDETLRLYQYLDGPGAWLVKDPKITWLNDPRYMPDGHLALRILGEETLLNTYLSVKTGRKPYRMSP